MKLAFIFDGTGASGEQQSLLEDQHGLHFDDDTIVLYLEGCQHPNVGNGRVNPDLKQAVDTITKSFNDQGEINLTKLRTLFGSAIVGMHIPNPEINEFLPDSILTTGFSRGAVTGCLLAKGLYEKKSTRTIPVDIVANQPVSGNHWNIPGSNVNMSIDCSKCENIRSATVLLGSYDTDNGWIENNFFYQIAPSFHARTKTTFIELPISSHLKCFDIPSLHVAKKIQDLKYSKSQIEYAEKIKEVYSYGGNLYTLTQQRKKQYIFHKEEVPIVVDDLFCESKRSELNQILSDDVVNRLFKNENHKRVIVSILCDIENVTTKIMDSIQGEKNEAKIARKIAILSHRYKVKVLESTEEFLSSENKKALYTNLKKAENDFNNSLKIDKYPKKRQAMRLLTNAIFTVATCGIGLIATSVINRNENLTRSEKTFPFFAQAKSQQQVKDLNSNLYCRLAMR
ncbi:hypothetical protein [Piscirickettsia litoralis]|uniref:DUF2235 domain-containing protein n=1 Tax=Piscirickettsia litoralis TaxID=1891921 RepID=A0ABX2ZWF9_9GAMM|nr:hypothetical protein [Piscirickettsia litoralis]ODN40951.1 hypothetical protein BGC07_18995 [Piscirickettsia litoralis]